METICVACKAACKAGSKFCNECGAALPVASEDVARAVQRATAGGRATRRQMTVVFCDLVGSTELAERIDPEDVLDVLTAYVERVRRVAARFGGFVARVVGDGIDIYFGYPTASEDDGVRAVHAGLAIGEQIGRLHEEAGFATPVKVRVGIATGLVAVGTHEALAIAGGTPNLAARIQASAQPGQVVIAPGTRRIAGGQFDYEDLGNFRLKGFEEVIRLTAVTGARALDSRSAYRGHDTTLALVGRDTELAALLQCWKGMTARPVITGVLITAEAGLGKSRLASALDERLASKQHTTLRLQSSPFHANSVLQPLVQHLTHAAGFAREDTLQIQLEKLEAQLAIAGIDTDLDLNLIASMMGLPFDDRYPQITLPAPAQLQMTKEVLRRYFIGLVSEPRKKLLDSSALPGPDDGLTTPLLLIVEDLHWIDPTTFELLDQLLSCRGEVPIMLLMTARPELGQVFTSPPMLMSLGRLDEREARLIATQVAVEVALPVSALDTIIQRSDGVPLYIEEMTRMLMDSHIEGQVPGHEIPDTLMDLLMERLDRLGPGKWLAQVGSVIGREFGRHLLYSAADMDRPAFEEALSAMLGASLVLPGDSIGERFSFKHALIEDAAYGSIVPKARVALHARLADILMREFAEAVIRQPEIAARHLSRAHRHLEASRYFLHAGGQALGRGAFREAGAHLAEGVAILSDVPSSRERSESELALLSVLGPTTMILRGPGSEAFRDVQQRAFTLCHELPGAPRQFPITYGLCLYHWGRAELDVARKLAEDLLVVAEGGGDDAEPVMAAHTMNGMIQLSLGYPRLARFHLERSVACFDPKRDAALYPVYLMDFGVFGRYYLALATLVTGDEEQASRHARDAYELAQQQDQPHTLGFSMLAICTIAVLRDQPALALAFAQQCVDFSSSMGFSEFVGMARIARGWATAREGRVLAGLEDLDEGIRLWRATSFENWQAWFGSLRADLLCELGRNEEALSEIQTQLDRIDRSGEALFRSLLMAQKATLWSANRSSADAGMRLFDEARAVSLAQQATAWTRRIEARRSMSTPLN